MTSQPPDAPQVTRDRARELRRSANTPERLLWSVLRKRRLGGVKFRRQHPIGPFILDFYCASARLGVEIDGLTHVGRASEDERRSELLDQWGVRVLRVTNDEVVEDLEAVAKLILRAVHDDRWEGANWR